MYHYYQHEQSVTKTVSVRRLQALAVDTLLRQMLVKANLYNSTAEAFEKYALQHIVSLGTMFFSIKNLSKQETDSGKRLIKEAFSSVNKEVVISTFSNQKKALWSALFSSPAMFLFFLQVRNLYHKAKR